MDAQNKEIFNYTYSAKQQEEIKAIRNKYVEPQKTEDKMTQLRRLDNAVTQKATTISLVIGIIGALIMGSGMSLIMTELYQKLNMSHGVGMLFGIILGIVGIALVGLAYPIYNRIIVKERKKIAPEIIRLTDELIQ